MSPSLPGGTPSGKPKLLQQVRKLLRVRHYSLQTEEAYTAWIRYRVGEAFYAETDAPENWAKSRCP